MASSVRVTHQPMAVVIAVMAMPTGPPRRPKAMFQARVAAVAATIAARALPVLTARRETAADDIVKRAASTPKLAISVVT
ncbi:hypothetical protein D3C87_559480 [compost metagenome]